MNWRGTKQQRVWYGLTATVVIGPGFCHQAGFGRFLIPHPPVVNWLLRKGVRQPEARSLAFLHEIAYFQTGPLTLLWLATNTAVANAAGNLNPLTAVFLLASSHAAWEIFAETYVSVTHRSFYRQCYRGVPNLPRMLFWVATATVSLAGWIVAI